MLYPEHTWVCFIYLLCRSRLGAFQVCPWAATLLSSVLPAMVAWGSQVWDKRTQLSPVKLEAMLAMYGATDTGSSRTVSTAEDLGTTGQKMSHCLCRPFRGLPSFGHAVMMTTYFTHKTVEHMRDQFRRDVSGDDLYSDMVNCVGACLGLLMVTVGHYIEHQITRFSHALKMILGISVWDEIDSRAVAPHCRTACRILTPYAAPCQIVDLGFGVRRPKPTGGPRRRRRGRRHHNTRPRAWRPRMHARQKNRSLLRRPLQQVLNDTSLEGGDRYECRRGRERHNTPAAGKTPVDPRPDFVPDLMHGNPSPPQPEINTPQDPDDIYEQSDEDEPEDESTAKVIYTTTVPEWKWAGGKVPYLMLNANALSKSKNNVKALDFGLLLQKFRWPSLVMVSEVDGIARKTNLHTLLGHDICRQYHVQYSMRSTSLGGQPLHSRGKVGGGIALLVHKRMRMSIRSMSLPTDPDKEYLLDGHVRWYRLDPMLNTADERRPPNASAFQRPLMVTVAYVPPAGRWGKLVRQLCFETLTAIDERIIELRNQEDVFALTMEHSNHPDGGVDLPLEYAGLYTTAEMRAALEQAKAASEVQRRFTGQLNLSTDGQLSLRRQKSRRAPEWHKAPKWLRAATKAGAAFSTTAARNGKVAVSGVMGARQSDSWTQCKFRRRGGAHHRPCGKRNCGRMAAVHDQLRLPPELIIQAKLCPFGGPDILTHKTRRIWWTDAIDHAVTWGSFFVAPLKQHVTDDIDASPDAPGQMSSDRATKRRRFANDLKTRNMDQHKIARTAHDLAKSTAALTRPGVQAMDQRIVEILRTAQGQSPPKDEKCAESVRTAKRNLKTAWETAATLRRRRRAQLTLNAPWSELEQRAHNRAQRALKAAEKILARSTALAIATAATRAKRYAPLTFWQIADGQAVDPGSLGQSTMGLLDVLNDSKGRLISRDRKSNWHYAASHRRSTHAIRPDLGAGQVELDRALLLVSEACQAILSTVDGQSLGLESYARKCAADATYPMQTCESRPGRPGTRALQDRVSIARVYLDTERRSGRFHDRGATIRAAHAEAVEALSAVITLPEVLHIFSILQDVGPGTDGIAPVILRKITESNLLTVDIVDLLNEIWLTGIMPEPWRLHRCLLCYKGKGSDPCCLGNYRGLGIDQCLLKVLALAMLERLDNFLKQTHGLSAAQGGFQRQRGTPEQIFTLSETVRTAVMSGRDVHLTFLDIAGAYDSVLHPILWKKCLDRGIYGRFLTTLMAIYDSASMVLELDGERSSPIPIECGVLQGNPLSPALFNIYIDDTIRALQNRGKSDADGPWGLSLPRVRQTDSCQLLVADPAYRTQEDFLTCLFFADDGVLLEFDLKRMQILIDLTRSELECIGLLLNIPKTKWLLVARAALAGSDPDAHAGLSNAAYRTLRAAALQTPLLVDGAPIALVAYFDYLGVKVSWRWNWQAAWRESTKRARFELHVLMRGGLHNCGLTMDQLCDYVRGKVACHFNYIAAISGAGGSQSSAPWLDSESILTRALQAVSGYAFADGDMLKIESGTWDQRTRIDMLLLRFFFKTCTTDVDAPLYRAMCLSIRSLTPAQRIAPASTDSHIHQLHRQPWAQQLAAALQRFQLPALNPDKLWEPISELVTMQAIDPDTGQFSGAGHASSLEPALRSEFQARLNMHRPFRLALVDVPNDALEQGVSCWDLPANAEYSTVFSTWSPQLRVACFAALRRAGNICRQQLVSATLRGATTASSSHRRFVAIKRASYLETYWFLPDLAAARRLLRVRLDNAAVRDVVLRSGRGNQGDIRVGDRRLRACYCCEPINGQPGIFRPETIDHLLLHCTAHQERRAVFKAAVRNLVTDEDTVDLMSATSTCAPPFDDGGDVAATAWLAVMKLCTGTGPAPVGPTTEPADAPRPPLVVFGPMTAAQVAACDVRDAPDLTWDSPTATTTARWIATLTQNWAKCLRPPWLDLALGREPTPQLTAHGPDPGQRLATLVSNYAKDIFYARRKLLLAPDNDYSRRARDPPRAAHQKRSVPPRHKPGAPTKRKAKPKPASAKRKPRPPPPISGPPAQRNSRLRPVPGPGRVILVHTRWPTSLPAPMHLSPGSDPIASPTRPASSVAQLHLGGAPPSAPSMPTL